MATVNDDEILSLLRTARDEFSAVILLHGVKNFNAALVDDLSYEQEIPNTD